MTPYHAGRQITPRTEGEDEGVVNIDILPEHQASIRETEDYNKKRKTTNDYCNRLQNMCDLMEVNYPDYYNQGCIPITEEQQIDKVRCHKQKIDFNYSVLNVACIQACISAHKHTECNENGIGTAQYSFVHLRKYKDAILHGSDREKQILPQGFEKIMRSFLQSLSKEKTQAKKKGELEENSADPISFNLCRLTCKVAIESGNIFAWIFTVLQWNCMARSCNVDGLGFNVFTIGKDSVMI